MSATTVRNYTSTFIYEKAPGTVYWNKFDYILLQGVAGTRAYGYMWFSMPFTKGVRIRKATLRLRTRALPTATTRTITVRGMTSPLDYTKVSWQTQPTFAWYGTEVSVTKTGALPANQVWEFDVTKLIQDVSDGRKWTGFFLFTNDPTGIAVHGRRANVAYVPQLDIEWSDAPSQPNELSPSGNSIVGLPKPTLRFDFEDYSGDTTLGSFQVQTNTSNSWTTPGWDSGEVISDLPQLDLASTTHPALTTGQTRWWRVRVRDSAGLWSPWSAGVAWTYRPLPSATLINPPTSGVVSDTTPPIDWGSSGQVAWRVSFYLMIRGKWSFMYSSGKRTGTTTSWTPTTALRSKNEYRVVVQVWDMYTNREATPGDRGYAQAHRDFVFNGTAGVLPPTTGTAVGRAPYPGVKLTWKRTEQPDEFVVYREGQLIARRAAADMYIGNGLYRADDIWAPRSTPRDYEVYAVVNKQLSKPLRIEGEGNHIGTWIGDPDDATHRLCIVQDRERTADFRESSEAHTILDSMAPVVITSNMGGREGSIQGLLRKVSGISTTAQEWKEVALDLKRQPLKTWWLMIGDECFRVQFTNVQVFRHPSMANTYNFSAQFYQVDDFNYKN